MANLNFDSRKSSDRVSFLSHVFGSQSLQVERTHQRLSITFRVNRMKEERTEMVILWLSLALVSWVCAHVLVKHIDTAGHRLRIKWRTFAKDTNGYSDFKHGKHCISQFLSLILIEWSYHTQSELWTYCLLFFSLDSSVGKNHFISILEFLDKIVIKALGIYFFKKLSNIKILTHLPLKWNHGDLMKKKSPKLKRVVTHYCEFLCNFQSVTVEITIITGKFFTIFAYTSVVYWFRTK